MTNEERDKPVSDLVAGVKVARSMGVSSVTMWRYCKRGWLTPIKICNKVFFRRSDIAAFEARAASGELANEPSGVAMPKGRS